MSANAYADTTTTVMEKFADRTPNESTLQNRLLTRETDSGNVALIAYGWLKIAEYDERRGVVTVFTGHRALKGKTTNKYLNKVMQVAKDRGRAVVASGESPTVDTPPESVKYINNYIDFVDKSKVESDAAESVRQALKRFE